MKKILLISLVIFLAINTAKSQRRTQTIKWFSLAAKGGIGNTVLINMDIFDDGNITPNYFALNNSFGGRFTFTLGDNLGFGTDLLFSSFKQEFTIENSGETYDKEIKFKAVDLVPFFRYTGNTGGYIEIGPKITTINSIIETNSNSETGRTNLIQFHEPKFTSIILGFGAALYRTERIDVNLGARLAYSFTDITPDKSYNATANGGYIPNYVMTQNTNPASIQLILEVNYYFAFWGDASCGRGRFMLFK